MTGARVASAVLVAWLLAMPGSAVAADDTFVVPGQTLSAVVADLDGDGAREVVQLEAPATAGAGFRLAVWYARGATWGQLAAGELPPILGAQPIGALVARHVEGRERVLALMNYGESNGTMCCLRAFDISIAADGRVALDEVGLGATDGTAQGIHVLDMDADGTDELLLEMPPVGAQRGFRTEVLRWDGSAFGVLERLTGALPVPSGGVGDSDGVLGDDVVFYPGDTGALVRLTMSDGRLAREEATGTTEGRYWYARTGSDGLTLYWGTQLDVVRWPRGEQPHILGSTPVRDGAHAWMTGSGADASVVIVEPPPSGTLRIQVRDRGLELRTTLDVDPDTEGVWELSARLSRSFAFPYDGPLGTTSDGEQVIVAGGYRIEPDRLGGFRATPMSPLVGLEPLGFVGADDAWIALTDSASLVPTQRQVYLFWDQAEQAPARLLLVPASSLEGTAPPEGAIRIGFDRAVVTDETDRSRRLIAARTGFTMTVDAPTGSQVVVVGGLGQETYDVDQGRALIDIVPESLAPADRDIMFKRDVLVVTPEGRVHIEHVGGDLLGGDLEVSVEAVTNAFAGSATLRGTTMRGATVAAGGQTATAADDGTFELVVDAGILPSHASVLVTDPLGRAASAIVEVVGFIDHRGWPWPVIIGIGVAAAGAAMYLRAGRRQGVAAPVTDDGATFEDLD